MQLSGKPVDVLLNVAGVMTAVENDALPTVTKDILTTTFETNTFGPLLLTQALLENLLAVEDGGAKVGIVSSRVGSIEGKYGAFSDD
jgi:NAD(P)-dependent dehydrogenase (short-subunit alcohol dehydrogenase family)